MERKVYQVVEEREMLIQTGAALTLGTNGKRYDSTKGPPSSLEANLINREFEMQYNAYAIVCHCKLPCVSDAILCRLMEWAKQASR